MICASHVHKVFGMLVKTWRLVQVASLGDSGFRLMRGGQCVFASEVCWCLKIDYHKHSSSHSLAATVSTQTMGWCGNGDKLLPGAEVSVEI